MVLGGMPKIVDAYVNGRVFKFNLAIKQKKPCFVPCVLFDPDDEVKDHLEQLQTTDQLVWLQGRISSYDFEYEGKPRRKIEIITYPKSIRTI